MNEKQAEELYKKAYQEGQKQGLNELFFIISQNTQVNSKSSILALIIKLKKEKPIDEKSKH